MIVKTKTLILETALTLFNERSVAAVTLRTIAAELGISQGNLSYHYKKKEDIVWLLYQKLLTEVNIQFETLDKADIVLNDLEPLLQRILLIFEKYRFFYLDLSFIIRQYPAIRKHYRQAQTQRLEQFKMFFHKMEKRGIFKSAIPTQRLEYLSMRLYILGEHWVTTKYIFGKGFYKELSQYMKMYLDSLQPYLK